MVLDGSRPPSDFLFRTDLEATDPFLADLIGQEQDRQARKLILIPSESSAPLAVRQALASVFQNIYAEGYPPLRMTREPEELLRDVAWQLANYRRYADRRFYKGAEYVDLLEALAQRRCADLYASGDVGPADIFVNVQPLSGAAANLAVYWALMEPGDTLMALDLYLGGHLTHGSEFNISGQRYSVASYGVDERTERLDYDAILDLALECRPRVIVAGYTSYPWAPDWAAFRDIADEVGAFLVADIAHTAGMAAAGVLASPVGVADVTTFTTHKTLCGPRGACILTTDGELAQAVDSAVFPGEQGGPHANKFAAMAVAFELARSPQFAQLQRRIVANAAALGRSLEAHGLRLAYGGTNTHLLLIDLKSILHESGCPVWGEPAVRILDLAGIVANKNTIPGDTETSLATGVRLGTPWVTQRGLGEADMEALGAAIAGLLRGIHPFAYQGMIGTLPRGKVELSLLDEVRRDVSALAANAGIDFEYQANQSPGLSCRGDMGEAGVTAMRVAGWRARQFLQEVSTASVADLAIGDTAEAYFLDKHGRSVALATIRREARDEFGRDAFTLFVTIEAVPRLSDWLKALGDGYILFDGQDLLRKVQGPVLVEEVEPTGLAGATVACVTPEPSVGTAASELVRSHPHRFALNKPYFIGQAHVNLAEPPEGCPPWTWKDRERRARRTPLADAHRRLGARLVPFAGWEMPVWYTSVGEEHRAVRGAAGLFDVGHMGVFAVEGPHAVSLLDTVCTNYVAWLDEGQSCYSYLLDTEGAVIDDVMVYRTSAERFLMVVNAANEAKDWDWLAQVNQGRVAIDRARPWVRTDACAVLRDLKDAAAGGLQLRDMALQGPASLPTLQALAADSQARWRLGRVRRTELMELELAGVPAIVARTGYTGEELGFELLIHPDHMDHLWHQVLDAGSELGVVAAGLGARDSTRTEAGLPLYGHELAGPFSISPIEAGFAGYVKYHKPFFVGRDPLLARESSRSREVVRFRITDRNVKRPRLGDPVVNSRGQEIGNVTSCSIGADGQLLGMAIVDRRYHVAGTHLSVFPLGGRALREGVMRGKRVTMPANATVLSRFPAKRRSLREAGE